MSSAQPAGYLAVPRSGSGPWPGVIVIHEAFGVNADIREHADRLASTGLLAFAPDLWAGSSKLRCVMRAFRELSTGRGPSFGALEKARVWLAGNPECNGRIGLVGFCVGGGFALLAAAQSDYAAAAVNYGQLPKDAELLRGACPVVASYGRRDPTLRGAAGRLQETLTQLGVPNDVREYPKAGHSFLSQYEGSGALRVLGRISYNADAAEDTWLRIDAFFAEHLKFEPAPRS